jgi:AcrR family transcriptional regulator
MGRSEMVAGTKALPSGSATDGVIRERETAAREVGHERVVEIQRARLLGALFEVSAERGSGNVAVAHVVGRAGVSRRTFYELFADREECFMAGWDEAIGQVSRFVFSSYDPGASWVKRVRMALLCFLEFLEAEHGMGELLIVGSLGAGPRVVERRRRTLDRLLAFIDEGRKETRNGSELPPLTAEGVIGGALSVLHTRMLDRSATDTSPASMRDGSLLELAGPLMSMIVLPYLGPVAAHKELARPAPVPQAPNHPTPRDPLREVGMRLTYRTVCVLQSIAANPGCSNRTIGLEAGMEDQGQISKLLARLQRLGLIHNTRPPTARGAPNAWGLTQAGWNVQHAIAGKDQHR